ncbi:MAG: hypothetical protein WAP37_00690, partial [Solirubrobacterales bacterium]
PPVPQQLPAPRPTSPRPEAEIFLVTPEPPVAVPVITPPPAPSLARPIPPTGGMARVYEEKREEEAATEDSQAFARYDSAQPPNAVYSLAGIALLVAMAAAAGTGRRRGGSRTRPVPALLASSNRQSPT